MERNFERDLNGMAAEREHNLEEYYAYMAVRVLDGCGAGPCDGEPCVITQHYRFSNPRPENCDVRNDSSSFTLASLYHQPHQAAAICDPPSTPSSG